MNNSFASVLEEDAKGDFISGFFHRGHGGAPGSDAI